jgi:hypothetical protein
MPKYKVEWKELITYSVEVEADDEFEAQVNASDEYGHDDEINCEYYDGSMKSERLDS